MRPFDWIAAGIVIGSMLYLTFILTIPEWIAGLRKGEAVSLLPEKEGQRLPLWAQLAVLLLGMAISIPFFYFLWIPLVNLSESTGRIIGIIGLIVYILGFGLLLWARRTLGKNWGISTSLHAKLHADQELIQSGPYTIVRHPMYFAAWIFMFGLVLLYPKWVILIFFISMLASLFMRARREEAALTERFGEKWEGYKKRTRLIIPFLF